MYDEYDHRKLGPQMDLFHFEEEAPGMVFWRPPGFELFRALEAAVRRQLERDDFLEVRTPAFYRKSLWVQSGHWDNFRELMFEVRGNEPDEASLKPVNCPAHIRMFERARPSYRELPFRLAEFGVVHRKEPSGSLFGLFRLRQFTQDDGHIFCSADQVEAEVARFSRGLLEFYRSFGFAAVEVVFSTRPEIRAGNDEAWNQAESWLEAAASAAGLRPRLQAGGGAFYGPKLEFVLKDRQGRDWQCGTIQLDLVLPERFDLRYVGEDGGFRRPVMLHRALLGSLERFIGVLLEDSKGALPLWLAPEQVLVASVTQDQEAEARAVHARLLAAGVRSRLDVRALTLGKRLREARLRGASLVAVIGDEEVRCGEVAVAARGEKSRRVSVEALSERCLAGPFREGRCW
jgi:threonyl-tRNA synthetase